MPSAKHNLLGIFLKQNYLTKCFHLFFYTRVNRENSDATDLDVGPFNCSIGFISV